ncbi:hypothetical protein BDQ17DRAFT_1419172 [Cyathus striatus]|nr:hypothetical protein BDQ17DRAFT_1419172 [Cyathus striatus]
MGFFVRPLRAADLGFGLSGSPVLDNSAGGHARLFRAVYGLPTWPYVLRFAVLRILLSVWPFAPDLLFCRLGAFRVAYGPPIVLVEFRSFSRFTRGAHSCHSDGLISQHLIPGLQHLAHATTAQAPSSSRSRVPVRQTINHSLRARIPTRQTFYFSCITVSALQSLSPIFSQASFFCSEEISARICYFIVRAVDEHSHGGPFAVLRLFRPASRLNDKLLLRYLLRVPIAAYSTAYPIGNRTIVQL